MASTFQSQDDLGSLNVHERLNYVLGQVLGVKEFQQEQAYFLNKAQEQNRELHGYGTVKGLEVTCEPLAQDSGQGKKGDWIIKVSPGLAIDQKGREIWVDKEQCANLTRWLNAASSILQSDQSKATLNWSRLRDLAGNKLGNLDDSKVLYVILCYAECKTGDQLILGEPCRTDADSVQKTRICDHFELRLSPTLPRQIEENHVQRLGELLARIKINPNLSKPKINNQEYEKNAFIKEICDEVDRVEGVFSKSFVVPKNMADAIFHELLQYWVVHTRPALIESFPVQDDCILIAQLQFKLKQPSSTSGNLEIEGNLTFDTLRRPYLLHTRLLQELLQRHEQSVSQLLVKTDEIFSKDENVGISEQNPEAKLHIKGDRIRLESSNGSKQLDLRADSTDLGLHTKTNDLYIRSQNHHVLINPLHNDEKVGIGTPNPETKLHVKGDRIRLEQHGKGLDLRADGSAVDLQTETSDLYIRSTGEGHHVAINSGVEDGNVGIGTPDPEAKLHVKGDGIRWESIEQLNQPKNTLDLRSSEDTIVLTTETSDLHIRSIGEGKHVVINPDSGDGNVGIGTSDPKAGLDVQPTLTASDDDEVLTGLHIKPTFYDGDKTGVKHYALVVEGGNVDVRGDVDINRNVDVKGDLTVQGRFHLNQPEQHLVRPNDLVAPASRAARLTLLNDYPVFTFQEGESASLSLLRPSRIQNEGPPTAYLRLYCTADKASTNGREIQWQICWRWVSSIGPIVRSFPFHEPLLIFPRRPAPGADSLVNVARRIEVLGADKTGAELLPSTQFSRPKTLKMRLYGETSDGAYKHYLNISEALTLEPADNALPADYLAINLKLQTSNDLPTVYLLMAEVRL